MKKKIFVFTLMFVLLISLAVTASVEQDKEMYHTLFTQAEENIAELFTDNFLNQVSESQVIQILNTYKNNLGQLQEVQETEEGYKLIFSKGSVPSKISVNTNNKIAGIWFGNMTLAEDDYEKILKEFKNLEGDISVYVIKDNQEEIIALNENEKMAVGSSFKLYVLKALYEQIESSEKSWQDIIKIDKENLSLPSGILQNWPLNTPMTVNSMANLMISHSDNTATDHLIDYIGRDYLEKMTGSQNTPFLKTIEMFRLKYGLSSQEQNDYIEGDLESKRTVLKEIKDIQISGKDIISEPTLIKEIEWFFSTKELSNTIYQLRESEEIQINPGLANKSDWYKVGYKGGSEAGVLQYTHLLQKSSDGPIYVVSVTGNSEEGLNTDKITNLTARLISTLN